MRWSTCLLTTFTLTLTACADAIHLVRQRQHQHQQHQQQQLHASLDTLQVYDLEEAHLNVGVKQEPFDWVKKIVNLKDIGLVRKEMISHYENEWKAKYGTTAPDTVYAKPFVQNPSNGYKYALDSFGRVIEATGPVSLQTGKSKEVPTAQMVYAMYWLSRGDAMEGGDWQIGHIIAKEYNGPHDNLLNYYPQARESNQGGGAWHRMERIAASLARHMDESNPGKCAVSLKITFEFKDKDMWIPSNGVYRMEITDTCWADLGKFIALKGTDTYTANFVKFSVVEGKTRVFQSKFIWNKADPFEDASVYPHLIKMEPMKAG